MWVVTALVILVIPIHRGFRLGLSRSRMSIRALRSDISLGSNDAAFDHLVRLSDTLAATPGPGFNANATQTLLALIALGDEWRAERPVAAGPGYQRVTGCMADSRVKTLLLNDGTLHISGYADSRVAQGMLALLARGLEGVSAAAVSDCRVSSVLARCAVTSLLPPGRFNGFTNMLQLVQDQTRLLLAGETLPMVATAEGSGYTEEVAVLLSGGVDSSVALRLLLEQGLSVRAFYLKIWLEDEIAHLNECPWEEDLGYAQAVCDQLKVPLEAVSLQREYWDEVVSYTFTEAQLGRTPNPDVMCNSRIKFGVFYEYIGKYFNKVATGHYAQIAMTTDGVARLLMSPDPVKDQSYFLSNLSQEQLRRCLFPIGHLEKSQVRVLAESFDLPTKTRKDSQGICFLGKLKFDDFIGHYLGQQPGPIKCYRTGRELGRHRGLWFHTIGQRKGLGLLLSGVVHEGPWFVADKHPASNTLLVTNDLSGIDRPRRIFLMDRINWIRELPVGLDTSEGVSLLLKLRHGPTLSRGTVRLVKGDHDDDKDERSGNNKLLLEVQLDRADKGIAPGQFAALYQDGECLGAGVVTETLRDDDAPSPSSLDEVVTGEVLFKQSRVLSF